MIHLHTVYFLALTVYFSEDDASGTLLFCKIAFLAWYWLTNHLHAVSLNNAHNIMLTIIPCIIIYIVLKHCKHTFFYIYEIFSTKVDKGSGLQFNLECFF